VTIKIYNTLGQEIVTLISEELGAGKHTALWSATGLSSGVYFYRLQVRPLDSAIGRDSKSGAGDLVQTKSLMLLK
jgi:hypothetical protein